MLTPTENDYLAIGYADPPAGGFHVTIKKIKYTCT
jgi:hypothetical protein